MTVDEYWNGPPVLVNAYLDAYKLKIRHENEAAWLQGVYMFNGVQVALSNGFGKKGQKRAKFPSEPFDLGLDTELEKQEKAKRARERIIESLTLWKAMWDKHNTEDGD